jgi:uncharacterized membrane protein YadS
LETHQKSYQKESLFFKVMQIATLFCCLHCFVPIIFVSPPIALVLGLLVANLFWASFLELNHKATNYLLQFSVVGLGFGMNVNSAVLQEKKACLHYFYCEYFNFRNFF